MEQTNIVKFTPSNFSFSPLHIYITFAEHLPVETNAIKFFGLQLDSQLSWKPHVNFLLYKLSSVCYIMRKLSHVLNMIQEHDPISTSKLKSIISNLIK